MAGPAEQPRQQKKIVIFDGVCLLCDRIVQLIIRHDPDQQFLFVPMQSALALMLLSRYDVAESPDTTLILIEVTGYRVRSDAALTIVASLRWPLRSLRVLRVLPASVRDSLYQLIARRRYRWFGQRATCMVPSALQAQRFLNG